MKLIFGTLLIFGLQAHALDFDLARKNFENAAIAANTLNQDCSTVSFKVEFIGAVLETLKPFIADVVDKAAKSNRVEVSNRTASHFTNAELQLKAINENYNVISKPSDKRPTLCSSSKANEQLLLEMYLVNLDTVLMEAQYNVGPSGYRK